MANNTQRLNETYQLRRGANGTLLVSQDGVKWQTPAEAGIATKLYVDEAATSTLASANEYTDIGVAGAKSYTNDEVDLAKAEMQNYTDDVVSEYDDDVTLRLSAKADLVGGTVPASQLPGFADTLQLYDSYGDFPSAGLTNVIYIDESTNKAYRWNGAAYTQIGESLVLGETENTAYRGDRGKVAYDHTTATNNPHSVNKAQVGLDQVDNTSDLDKPVSTATSAALSGKANTVHTHVPADITGLQGALDAKANSSSLAAVATTGDYGDLLNIPAPLDISGKLDKSGGTMSGGLNLGGNKITNLASGTNSGDAVNKGQMDAAIAGAGGSSVWGGITGSISNQADLQTALNGKEGSIAAGATTQYYRGDKSWATLTKGAVGLSNVDNTSDANKPVSTATQTALNGKANTSHTHVPADVTGLSTLLDGKENTFAKGSIIEGDNVSIAGDLSNRLVGPGDITISATDAPAPLVLSVAGKTGAVTLAKADVGLGSVDNTSDANKPVSTATQTALNGKADTSHTHAAGDITSGTFNTARLGSGTANNTKYLAGDSTWKDLPAAGGDATTSTAQTFTNKRINPRVSSTASGSTLTPTVASFDQYAYTALAANLTINAPTGTPVNGNKLIFRIKDNGTSRTLTWNAAYRAVGVDLPTATVVGKTLYVGAIYNAADTKWDVIAVAQEA